jgi:arabinose-5-phosphate isomerase
MTSYLLKRLSSSELPGTQDAVDIRVAGLQSLQLGITAMQELAGALTNELGANFEAAVRLVLSTKGRLIVSGIGKSGHIGCKIASTLASTGTPAFFVHPTEASHGDLGMIMSEDAILALSWSGETAELDDLIRFSRRLRVPLIALTSNRESTLGLAADVVLALPKVRESCPYDLAPTSSSLIQLAIGDALAIALLKQRGFTPSSFQIFHPGGKLAARLMTVQALMHAGEEMPLVCRGAVMSDVLLAITGGRFGCVGVVDADFRLVGIVTDGDLRRNMGGGLLAMSVDDVMTVAPVTVNPTLLASAALEIMNRKQITAVFVVDERRLIGILHIHDLIRAGVI